MKIKYLLIIVFWLSLPNLAFADTVLREIEQVFRDTSSKWEPAIKGYATWLFWTLGSISFTWTMGMLAIKKADIGEFYAETIRFILFFGFYKWLLDHGSEYANNIIDSMKQIGQDASFAASKGQTSGSIDDIVDIGLRIADTAANWHGPVDTLILAIIGILILICLLTIAVNYMLVKIASWVLIYAGIFFLGFGGAKWTSEMAIGYYKQVLNTGIQLMVINLLISVAYSIISNLEAGIDDGAIMSYLVALASSFSLMLLVEKVPHMVASIVSGGHGGHGGVGMGTGMVVGAGLAATGAAVGAASTAINQTAGAGSAVREAMRMADEYRASNNSEATSSASKMENMAEKAALASQFVVRGAGRAAMDSLNNLSSNTVGDAIKTGMKNNQADAAAAKKDNGSTDKTQANGGNETPDFSGDSLSGKND